MHGGYQLSAFEAGCSEVTYTRHAAAAAEAADEAAAET